MSEYLPRTRGPTYQHHQDLIILCKKPKPRQDRLFHCTVVIGYTMEGAPIFCGETYRTMRYRKIKLPYCEHHLRSYVQLNRKR